MSTLIPPNSTNYTCRKATRSDQDAILDLYKRVSKTEGGIARKEEEITKKYVENFSRLSLKNGAQFVVMSEHQTIIGEIHCYKLEPAVFSHILSDLTVVVDPSYQGKGVGKLLFDSLLSYVRVERNDIMRIELIARETNASAIKLYKKLGFVEEGRLEKRIKTSVGFEADIPMAWIK